MARTTTSRLTSIGGETPTNGAALAVSYGVPYVAAVTIVGTADLLFHRWNCESIDEKSKASKGSKAKKSDDVESYVFRSSDSKICLPGEYLRQAIIHAAKYKQDPRSPRKSAMDLFKAALVSLTPLAPILVGSSPAPTKVWDYLHRCRVTIQRNGITRERPAMREGWSCKVDLLVNLPEYIGPALLHEVLTSAGKLIGVGDFRPTYGRFRITSFAEREA